MRPTFRPSSFLILATALTTGAAGPAKPPTSQPAAAEKVCEMTSGGVTVLRLTAPAGTTTKSSAGSLHVNAPKYDVELWLVNGAETVDEAVARVRSQIVDEFRDFKADKTTDLTIAGSQAKRLVGTGHEADDGDPGAADVIVFKVGDHVFVACNHGESLNAAGQEGLLELVQTAGAGK